MPRANRYYLEGHVWHITQRCLDRAFMLGFARDRRRWMYWLFEARRRYGLCALNYVVTSNHIHLLVLDRGLDEIARSMQLLSGRVAQEFNLRKQRSGGYWEDRYHATAVQCDSHLARCVTYIDLNMVRAGVVAHPDEWKFGGYRELMDCRRRYRTLDVEAMTRLLGCEDAESLRAARADAVDEALGAQPLQREPLWSESVAVGSRAYVHGVQAELGPGARHRSIERTDDGFTLREPLPQRYMPFSRPKTRSKRL